jgi:cytochrome P450
VESDAAITAAEHFTTYFGALIEQRRRRPGDDVISALVAASDAGGPSAQELVGACTLLLFAGHETTSGLLANGTSVLLEHEHARARLADDPLLWPSAVEELMRFEGPAKLMARKATEDRSWCGVDIAERDTVYLVILAANRDPSVFADPDTFDVTRDPNPHLGFGWGLHHCLGAALARLEARIALRRLFERFPKLSLSDPVRWGGGVIGRAVWSVPVSVA